MEKTVFAFSIAVFVILIFIPHHMYIAVQIDSKISSSFYVGRTFCTIIEDEMSHLCSSISDVLFGHLLLLTFNFG